MRQTNLGISKVLNWTYIALLSIIISIGCDSVTNPSKKENNPNGISNLFKKPGDFHVYSNLITYTSESHYKANGSEFTVIESVSQADFFKDNVVGAVDAGDARHNNILIHKRVHDISPDGYSYEYKSSSLANEVITLQFNGSMQIWNISGSQDFPAFTDSIRAPYYQVILSTPAFNSTYSKSSGIPLNWSVGSYPSDSVYIRVVGTTGVKYKIVANTGNALFTPDELTNISIGVATVEIFDGNALFKTLSIAKIAFIAAYSSYSVDINLIQ